MSVSIKKAADLMGISEQFLRVLIQKEKLPFASAVKMDNTSKRFNYYINANGLAEHIGKPIEEVTA
jgi:hypothetical protein